LEYLESESPSREGARADDITQWHQPMISPSNNIANDGIIQEYSITYLAHVKCRVPGWAS